MRAPSALVASLVAAAAIAGCSSCKDRNKPPPNDVFAAKVEPPAGNAAHGKELVAEFQCNRCHDGADLGTAALDKHCVHCHQEITSGSFKAAPEALAKWQPIIKDLVEAPSLEGIAKRYRRGWVEKYLLQPHDVRPNLVSTMPRLALTESQARDIATFLTREASASADVAPGDAERGKRVLDSKGCGTCHKMTGAAPIAAAPIPVAIDAKQMARALVLAPDLRHTRDRFTPSALVAWLRDPRALKPDTSMPTIPMTEQEARDVATLLFTAKLDAPAAEPFKRLPVLDRPVRFDEVNKKVFHKTCWHCHSEPDYAIGDGGPGNSGGFGFKPRGVDLSSYQGISSGYLDESGSRKSLFSPAKSGTPRLVEALVARHAEEGGAATGEVRGMPLGLPPLSAEEIQLVETWVAQGRPR